MRTNYSVKNSLTAIISNLIIFFIAFIAQAIFIRILGAEYLGLNGLFSNIITILSIFELGIGNAIVFNLYKPIAENDTEKINSLMSFYKRAYNMIAFLIFIFGILLMPFLKYIVGDISIDINIYLVYFLFILSTVSSYLMIYKRNLIIATQRNYIINIVHMIYLIILNFSQLLILFLTKNYYLYLIIKIALQFVENFVITYIASKLYPNINIFNAKKLDKETEEDIFNRVKALVFHKVGTVIINGTDNILISHFLGIIQVGLYSNYYTVINAINMIFSQVISSTTASVGNLLITESKDKIFDTFKKIRFLNFWIACFTGVCLLVLLQPFISIWVGEQYLLEFSVVCVLVFNYYQKMMRNSYSTFKDSGGIWIEDRYVPLIESILNIFFSILFLKLFGLVGVFIGTIFSGLALWLYSYPKFVYKNLFGRKYKDYFKETFGYIFLFFIICFIVYSITSKVNLNNLILQILLNLIICIIVPNFILVVIFRKSSNFKYFMTLLNKILSRIKNVIKR